jgi:hypothetical protein
MKPHPIIILCFKASPTLEDVYQEISGDITTDVATHTYT